MEARSQRSSARIAPQPQQSAHHSAAGGPGGRAAAAAARRARAAARLAEVEDSPRVLRDKCRRLARAIRNAKHLVVYTGAGISTAADIPDYRGPHGVWTRLQRGQSPPRAEVARARPTLTHMALTALWARGALKFVVSQNCDGLHLRAGLPRRALAELHGDMFVELCSACRRAYLRAFDTTERTARHAHATRRLCHDCGAELRDSIVHFGERGRAAWPLNWAGALRHAAAADVILCLGSSLKVLRRYPRLWSMARPPHARPRLYIVNLQWTPKDSVAALKINARCDTVMAEVARRLRLRVPHYSARHDPLLAHATALAPEERHTSRRRALSPPSGSDSCSSAPDPSSPSASDSEEERPLTQLARRLRPLTAVTVPLLDRDATLLLRADHVRPDSPGAGDDYKDFEDLKDTKDDGFGLIKACKDVVKDCNGLKEEKCVVKEESEKPADKSADEAAPPAWCEGAARRIIRRAVLLCRHQLYPGLHTILAPAAPACAWCWARRGARRCLWYPARDPVAPRAWRRVARRRYLCACCGPGVSAPADTPDRPAESSDRPDAPGWFGKGYRKPRRRR